MIETSETLTPRESIIMAAEQEEARLAREHDITVKRLELDATKLEQKWTQIYRIPILIIKLPVYTLLALSYIVAMARKHEPSDRFWDFLRK